MRIAIATIYPILGDINKNIALHNRYIDMAIKNKADAILFPELSLTGYFVKDLVPELSKPADKLNIFDSSKIDIVYGAIESERYQYYNTGVYLHKGNIAHIHRKIYLPNYGLFDEARFFHKGNSLMTFDADEYRAGILVCEDLWHPENIASLASSGLDILYALIASPINGIDEHGITSANFYKDMAKVYAKLYTTNIVIANRSGVEDGFSFWGEAIACDPYGHLLEQEKIDEHLSIVEIHKADLTNARWHLPLLRDRAQ